jgi:hypothetical protein
VIEAALDNQPISHYPSVGGIGGHIFRCHIPVFLVYLVYLVCLVFLVSLVSLVFLVWGTWGRSGSGVTSSDVIFSSASPISLIWSFWFSQFKNSKTLWFEGQVYTIDYLLKTMKSLVLWVIESFNHEVNESFDPEYIGMEKSLEFKLSTEQMKGGLLFQILYP